jgi:glycerophosphoryl diester phosphodiesterase
MKKSENDILVVGHRGASSIAPENTLKAFKKAIELKADYVEFDVQETRDGKLVITHDDDVKRITGQDGLITDMTLDELKKLNFGENEKIPTLEELISLTKNKISLNCEIKVEGIAEKVLRILREFDVLETTIVSSFLHDELLKFASLEPTLKLASLEPTAGIMKLDWDKKKVMIQYCIDNDLYAINPIVMMVDQQFVDFAHDSNIKVFPWTVDSKVSIKKLIRFGVDGIITNDIVRVRNILQSLS